MLWLEGSGMVADAKLDKEKPLSTRAKWVERITGKEKRKERLTYRVSQRC